jgi:thiamine-phosphate pyrophosphorylase
MNGRVDFALLEGLAGVHRPSDGVSLGEMIRIGGDDLLYGQSTHSTEEVRRAFDQGSDYVLFGPIFPTPSKPNLGREDIPGLDGLESVTDRVGEPVLALGGITPDRVSACLDAGAHGVAGIRVLFAPEDPRSNWNQIQASLQQKE